MLKHTSHSHTHSYTHTYTSHIHFSVTHIVTPTLPPYTHTHSIHIQLCFTCTQMHAHTETPTHMHVHTLTHSQVSSSLLERTLSFGFPCKKFLVSKREGKRKQESTCLSPEAEYNLVQALPGGLLTSSQQFSLCWVSQHRRALYWTPELNLGTGKW